MQKQLTLILLPMLFSLVAFAQNEPFNVRVVNPLYQLKSAWELTWGPDDSLWVTENSAYKVSRIDPVGGGKTELIDLSTKKDFTSPPKWPQGGLMGLALHPTMYSEWPNASKPYIYLAYVYHFVGCAPSNGPCRYKTKIVRYNYNRVTHSLSNEQIIIDTLNGSNDHNSGRLTIGKISGKPYLFYTIGDMGAGQFNNVNRTNNAQTRDTLEGKILRFNLEKVSGSWVPADNPFKDANNKRTAVWSWGHRNAQGIAFGSNGKLYQSEQQDMSDDEVNIIDSSRNYGWPKLSGYCDGNYDGLKLANKTVVSELANSTALNAVAPIHTLHTVSDPSPGKLGGDYLKWPTVACSSIDVYEHNIIPGWNRSLLVTSLKAGRIFRLKLDSAGTSVIDTSTIPAMRGLGRYRDLCISPDGLKIYVACDMSGQTSGPTGGFNGGGTAPPNAGRILEFSYTGSVLALDTNQYVHNRPENLQIEIYPNPATKIFYVRGIKNTTKPLHYFVYDVTGKLLIEGKSNQNDFSVNIEKLTKGVYIFKLFNAFDFNLTTKKIVVQ